MNQKFTKEKRGHPKNEINRFGMLIAGSVSTFSLLRYLNFSAKIAGSVQTFGLMSQTEAKNSIFYENLPNHLLEFSLCGEKKNRDFISDFLGWNKFKNGRVFLNHNFSAIFAQFFMWFLCGLGTSVASF